MLCSRILRFISFFSLWVFRNFFRVTWETFLVILWEINRFSPIWVGPIWPRIAGLSLAQLNLKLKRFVLDFTRVEWMLFVLKVCVCAIMFVWVIRNLFCSASRSCFYCSFWSLFSFSKSRIWSIEVILFAFFNAFYFSYLWNNL